MTLILLGDLDATKSLRALRRPELIHTRFQYRLKRIGRKLYIKAKTDHKVHDSKIYAVPVLRAGLGLYQGACIGGHSGKVGFIDIKRDEETLLPSLGMYKCAPDISNYVTFVFETMLATGGSLSKAITTLKDRSQAQKIVAITLICAPQGITRLQTDHPDVDIYTVSVDEGLDEHGYIVPGLGDAGDRLYGEID